MLGRSAGRLAGVVALVTGGASGIGRAVSARLARHGARVAVADRDGAGAAMTASGLDSAGDSAGDSPGDSAGDSGGHSPGDSGGHSPGDSPGDSGGHSPGDSAGDSGGHLGIAVDVADRDSVAGMLREVQARFGAPPAVLVSCAGITRDRLFLELREEEFRQVLAVNLQGTFLVAQLVTQALVASGTAAGASLVLVGSVVAKVGNWGQCHYAASKAGVEALTRSVAKEVARFGIRCNCVLPGLIVTPMTAKVPPKVLAKFAGSVPLGRLGEPEDVADVVTFLASRDSAYVTGASLEVTGGLFM